MPAVKPVRLLVKVPVVPASVVLESEVVGTALVLHTTPLAVIGLPPSLVMFPPLMAVVDVILVAAVVAAIVGFGTVAALPIILLHIPPEYTSSSPPTLSVVPQLVQNTTSPVAGLAIPCICA